VHQEERGARASEMRKKAPLFLAAEPVRLRRAVAMAELVAGDAAPDCCGYEIWRGQTKVAHRAIAEAEAT
jgi:hypothetical protein